MLPLTWLDVFTSAPLTGNGLAVVHDADALDDATMLAFARETKLSETTFVQSSDRADYRNRIWTTRGEIPFAGHPSLGTAAAVVRARGERAATVVQETGAGLQPIDVELDGDRARTSMLQEPLRYPGELDLAEVLALTGLAEDDLDPAIPVALAATGVPQVIVPVRDAGILDRLRVPDLQGLIDLLDAHQAITYYVAAVDGERAVARAFFPSGDAGEDPATGSAAGPLCAHVHACTGTARLTISQGAAIGRPSTLRAEMDGDRVRVGGDAVVVLDGHVRLDA